MYWSHQIERGRPAERKRNLLDLLRLTLGAVELSSTRREAMSSVAAGASPKWLPGGVSDHKHAVYETSVVFDFTQLAAHDFASHSNEAVWERPLTYLPAGATYWRRISIDLSLFSATRNVETRIEFGRAKPKSRPTLRDEKLEEDAGKLFDARVARLAAKDDPDPSRLDVENFIILWDERHSEQSREAKLTVNRGEVWLDRCQQYAQAATTRLNGPTVTLEGVAASSLMTLEPRTHRTAFAALYAIE